MKRYRFRLAQVQRVRSVQEDLAAASLAAAQRAERAARAGADERAAAVARRARPCGATSGSALTAARLVWDAELRALAEARRLLAHCAEEAEAARLGWIDARARVRALDLLDGRHRAEHAIAVARDEAARVDDLVVGRLHRGSS